jgi:hypothetical protein
MALAITELRKDNVPLATAVFPFSPIVGTEQRIS